MSSLPQLRIRSGYSFKQAFGRVDEISNRLKAIDCTYGGLVDDMNTWGHARWEKAIKKAEQKPMFGMEIKIKVPLGEDETGAMQYAEARPRAWILASDSRLFYNATSKAVQNDGLTPEEFGALKGVTRFCGGAVNVLAADQYDFADVNPSSILLASQVLAAAKKGKKKVVVTSYNDMPAKTDERHAYAWKVRESVGVRHIATEEEIWDVLKLVMTKAAFNKAVKQTHDVAAMLCDVLAVELKKAPIIHLEGDMIALAREGMEYRLKAGHIKEWTQVYEDRFNEEIAQIQNKDFDSYFLVVADMIRFAKTKMLVGPARGSSAGSLVCYCMGITEVDPLPFDLLFQRFIDISRADLPDIDVDFTDTKRYLVFDYLKEKYGAANVCKLGNINTLKAASVMKQVGAKFNVPFHETDQVKNALIEYSSGDARYGKGLQDTFDTTTTGQEFIRSYPIAGDCMSVLELHPSHSGVHAAGIVVCNDPVADYCTITAEGIAQIDKPDSEYLNLLKIDALGLRTLGIIEDTGVVTAEQLYGLKLDDPNVFSIINADKVNGIFQFEGNAVRSVARSVNVDQFSKIDNLTALGRPGPLASGMAAKYIARAGGKEPVTYDVPQLEKYLGDTFGVFLYQEQIMSVVKEVGLFDWVKTSAVRKAMSGRKGEEYFNVMGADFVKGAVSQGVPEQEAEKIWNEMVTFGSWGFNKSHSVSYAVVTYWTCWLKYYHPLEFAAASLRAAKDDEQTIAILREMAKEGVEYTPIDPQYSDMHWKVVNGRLLGGIMNAKGYGPITAARYIEARDAGKLTQKQMDKLAESEIKFQDLYEGRALWGHLYDKPKLVKVIGERIKFMKDIKNKDDGVIIGKMVKKILADENEAIRIKKRGGKRIEDAPTAFIDLMLVDDSTDSPMRFRVRPDKFEKWGKDIAENAAKGDWFLVRGWKISGIDMFIIKNIRKLEKGEGLPQPVTIEHEEEENDDEPT